MKIQSKQLFTMCGRIGTMQIDNEIVLNKFLFSFYRTDIDYQEICKGKYCAGYRIEKSIIKNVCITLYDFSIIKPFPSPEDTVNFIVDSRHSFLKLTNKGIEFKKEDCIEIIEKSIVTTGQTEMNYITVQKVEDKKLIIEIYKDLKSYEESKKELEKCY